MPFLQSIIVFSYEMRADLMVEHSLDSVMPILNRKTYHNSRNSIAVVMDYTRGRDCVLCELVGQQTSEIEVLDIFVEFCRRFLDRQ